MIKNKTTNSHIIHADTIELLQKQLVMCKEALNKIDKFFMDNDDHRGTAPHLIVSLTLHKLTAPQDAKER